MDNHYFAYMHINILKIPMVAVSVIQGVSMSIIGEKRLGKPPLPSGGLTIQPPYSTPMGPWGGWGGGRVHQRGGADVHQPLPSRFRRFYGTY